MAASDELKERLEGQILQALSTAAEVDSVTLAQQLNVDHKDLVGAMKSLEAKFQVESTLEQRRTLVLTELGADAIANGSPEARTFHAVPPGGISLTELNKLPFAKQGFGNAKFKGWLTIDQSKLVTRTVDSIEDTTLIKLKEVQKANGDPSALTPEEIDYYVNKRKVLSDKTIKIFRIKKGPQYGRISDEARELTRAMILDGSWRTQKFKSFNWNALGVRPSGGHLHPLLKVRAQYREIFLEMGFEEMPTNNFVESSFWNFDALFQPQQHPARDAHDTFFMSEPAETLQLPEEYVARVKDMHERGSEQSGSIGYRYDWKLAEAKKNIMRTHTTAVSARMLYRLAQQMKKEGGVFTPKKYFSIDRVFRNETLDKTHLAEFHQIEGLVADRGLTLGDLIGVIQQFFRKLGIEKLRFKPAYNPYTEPSMEVFGYNAAADKWLEIGNSGVFRPEMLLPMGLPEDVSVIAWGLSVERPTMIKYNIDNIRDLVGPAVPLDSIARHPVVRLDKHREYRRKEAKQAK